MAKKTVAAKKRNVKVDAMGQWGSAEVEVGLAIGILSVGDDATITHVDIDTIVGLDAVDGLELCATFGIQLIIGTTIYDGSLDARAFEGATSNGNYGAATMLGVVNTKSLSKCNLELQGKLQLWSLGLLYLCADIE